MCKSTGQCYADANHTFQCSRRINYYQRQIYVSLKHKANNTKDSLTKHLIQHQQLIDTSSLVNWKPWYATESWQTSTVLSPQGWAHMNRQTCLWFCMLWTWQNRTKNPFLNVLFLALCMAPQLETEPHKRTLSQSPASTQIWPTWPK